MKKENIEMMIGKIEEYVDKKRDEFPNLKECCLRNGWDYDELCEMANENPRLRKAVCMLICQRAVNLELCGIYGVIDKPMTALLLDLAEQERISVTQLRALKILDQRLQNEESLAKLVTYDLNPQDYEDSCV